jgi:hypothetical protein
MFSHEGLSIGEMFEAMMGNYLQEVLRHLDVFSKILDVHWDIAQLIVPHSSEVASATTGPFARFQVHLVPRVGEFVAKNRGLAFKALGEPHAEEVILFPAQPWLRSFVQIVYNFCISTVVPRRKIRILVSDYWRNIKPFIEKMDDVELVFVDRKEVRNIPWRDLFKYRMRFIHPLDMLTSGTVKMASIKQQEFKAQWDSAKHSVAAMSGFMYRDLNWWELVEPVFTYVVSIYSERVVADIESTKRMLGNFSINRVLIRASISGQHHFFIMGELPHHYGIPSIEIQHGIGVGIMDPHSAFGLMHADYVAAYGPMVERGFARSGYAKERIVSTGSPRFDRYYTERDTLTKEERDKKICEMGLDPKRPIVFVVMQEESNHLELAASSFSSYECRDFIDSLKVIRDAIPELQMILKFRSPGQRAIYEDYIAKTLPREGIVLKDGDAFSLLLLSDLVYSCFSTLLNECIMGRKPVILYPLKKGDTYFYDAHKDGVLTVPLLADSQPLPTREVIEYTKKLINNKEFYRESVEKGQTYLKNNVLFTGDAATRVATLIRTATKPIVSN